MRTTAIEIKGARSATAALTWPQRRTWRGSWLKSRCAKAQLVPPGTSLRDVIDAVKWAYEEFETLRTRFPVGEDGEPCQRVEKTETVEVLILDSTAESAETDLEAAIRELELGRHDQTTDLPARFAVVVVAGLPTHLVSAASHLSLDGHGYLVLSDALDARLCSGDGRPAAAPRLQPVERARQEQSEAGRKTSEAALAYWRDVLEKCPLVDPLSRSAVMDSAALRAATDLLAERHGVSSSAVYLTAAALTAGALTRQSLCSFVSPSSNRGDTDEQNYVGELVQDAPGIVEDLEAPFGAVLEEAWGASIEGMMNSHYDEQSLLCLRQEIDELKAQRVLFDIAFNDLRSPARYTSAEDAITDLRKAMARTRVAPQEEIYRGDSRFLSVLLYDGDGQRPAEMSVLVNDAYFPGVPVERMLRAVEELVVGVALEEPEPSVRPLEFVRGLLC